MVFLNCLSSGSMKWIPRNFRSFSRWIFSWDHFCFFFSLACFPIDFQISGHKWPGLDVSCFLINLSPDHMYPLGGSSSNRVNCVKPVQESEKISGSIDVPAVVDAAFWHNIQVCMCSSGNVNVLQWNRERFFSRRVKFDGSIWSFLTWTRHRLSLHRHPDVSHEVVEKTLLILQESQILLPRRIGRCRIKVDVLRSWSRPTVLIRPSAIGKINSPFSLWNITSFALSLFE